MSLAVVSVCAVALLAFRDSTRESHSALLGVVSWSGDDGKMDGVVGGGGGSSKALVHSKVKTEEQFRSILAAAKGGCSLLDAPFAQEH